MYCSKFIFYAFYVPEFLCLFISIWPFCWKTYLFITHKIEAAAGVERSKFTFCSFFSTNICEMQLNCFQEACRVLLCIPYYPPSKIKIPFCRLENLPYESPFWFFLFHRVPRWIFFPDFEPSGNSRIYSWPSTLATHFFIFFFIAVTDVILIFSTRNKKNTHGKILKMVFLYLFLLQR